MDFLHGVFLFGICVDFAKSGGEMTQLETLLAEIKSRAEKNLEEAKQLIQPEKSWIRDQQTILIQNAVIEKLIEFSDDMIEARWADTYKNQKWNREAVEKDKTERDQHLAHLIEELRK